MPDSRTAIVSSIEDRNGNLVRYANNGSGVLTITDTAGRVAVETSGFGATGNTVAVSGLSTAYTLTWGITATWNYSVQPVEVDVPSNVTCTGTWPLATPVSGSGTVLSYLTLPNTKKYKFLYDSTYGLLNEIDYPNGGWVKYTWGFAPQSEVFFQSGTATGGLSGECGWRFGTPVILERQVSYDGSTTAQDQKFTYSTTWTDNNNDYTATEWTSKKTLIKTYDKVRDPSGNTYFQTTYLYAPTNTPPAIYATSYPGTQVPVEQQITYQDWNGSTLQTVNKTWYNQYLLKSSQTIPAQGSASTVNYSYGSLGVLTEKDEYDYGQSTAARKTLTTYQAFAANPLGSTIYDRPCKTVIQDGGGHSFAETDYLYDGGTGVCGASGSLSVSAVSGLPAGTHDETHYAAISTAARGNATSVKRTNTSGTASIHTYSYDETGQVVSSTDGCGNATCADMPNGVSHKTTYSYTDSPTNGNSAGDSNAYVTTITNPLGQTQLYQYNYASGELTQSEDANSQPTTYDYNDPLNRLKDVYGPPSAQNANAKPHTSYSYVDGVGANTTMIDPVGVTSVTFYDGLGNVKRTELSSDPSNPDYVDTAYDGLGRVLSVSNSYRSTGDSTYGTTTYVYDALGRKTLQTQPDGSTQSWSYSANAVNFTDELGSQWQRTADSLGRLTKVLEPNGASQAPSMETDYTYDPLDNLLTVGQWGGPNATAGERTRTFVYDGLSQLTSATNPESGTVIFAYDANGNVTTKTDARNIITTLSYDSLNRLTQKQASGINYVYWYDNSGGGQSTNGIGRLTFQSNYVNADEVYSYDEMGRIVQENYWTPSSPNNTSLLAKANYNLAGNLTSLIYPDGRALSQSWNGAGRVQAVNGTSPASYLYATFSGYSAGGESTTVAYGNGVNETSQFNNRLQMTNREYSNPQAGPYFNTSFTFTDANGHNNGNIYSQVNNLSPQLTWTYTYDTLNRVASVLEQDNAYAQNFTYDGFGNLSQSGSFSFQQGYATTNRVLNWNFDASGNLLTDQSTNCHLAYDAESKLTSVSSCQSGTPATYVYGPDGQRVSSNFGSTWTEDIYFGGMLIAQKNQANAWTDYIYGGGKRIARTSSTGTTFYNTDHLGSTRQTQSQTPGTPLAWNYTPFGRDLPGNPAGELIKFTGQLFDYESSLQYFGARYYSGIEGRFLSPDFNAMGDDLNPVPYADLSNPQSLNLYTYVRNNPLSRTDPFGHADDPCKGIPNCASVTANPPSMLDQLRSWTTSLSIGFMRFGRLGGPAHRAAVGRISDLLEKDGYSVTREKYFRTPKGSKSGRFVDVYGQKTTKDGVQEKMFQVGRTNADGTPVSREVQAMDDIQAAPANTSGLRPDFVDYNSPLATGDFAPVSPMSDMPMSVPEDIPIDPIP